MAASFRLGGGGVERRQVQANVQAKRLEAKANVLAVTKDKRLEVQATLKELNPADLFCVSTVYQ